MFNLFLDLLVLTVASESTDGFKRFMHSTNLNGLKTKVNLITFIFAFKYVLMFHFYLGDWFG